MKKVTYTIVPISSYEDKSCLTKEQLKNLFETIELLCSRGMTITIPTGEGGVDEKGVFGIYSNALNIYSRPKVIKKEDGKFALLGTFLKEKPEENKKTKTVKEIKDFDQKYFPEFIMPILKYINNYILEEGLKFHFLNLALKDRKFNFLRIDFQKIIFDKTRAVAEQEYEKAASLRDKEKKIRQQLYKHLLPKVERFLKKYPDLFMEPNYDWFS